MFTVCLQFSVVPNSFTKGLLLPLLKKPTSDAGVAKNYRTVVLSTIYSKILEMYILDEVSDFTFNDFQFGFVKGRGTSTATALAHDVASYCTQNGSQVGLYMCSLDVEGAYDALPHPVIFEKAMDVLSDMSWCLLYKWYCNIYLFRLNGSTTVDLSLFVREPGKTDPPPPFCLIYFTRNWLIP